MSSGHVLHGSDVPPPTIEEVAAGVFAYIQLDGSWFLNNAGCIPGSRTATVIDTVGTEARAHAWQAAVQRITPHRVSTLVNTHHHADHTNGNFLFADAAIVAHENCRDEVKLAQWPRTSPVFPGTDFGDCPMTPPTVTFADEVKLYVDDLELQLFFVGPAHTTNDVAVWIPEKRVLFTGDVVFNGGTPFALFGSLGGWLRALDRFEALGPAVVVPGHGPVSGPEVFAAVRAYVRFVLDAAKRGLDAGVSPAEVAKELDLGPYAALTDAERLVPNLHRAYSELRGEPWATPLPVMEMMRAMVEYNGGRPLRCIA
ncbi:MAG: MBL fold metallo-hydrolase [Dehalococcoidia bacterium]